MDQFDWDDIDDGAIDRWCHRIDHWLDCADFDIVRLLTLWHGYGEHLPVRVRDALRRRLTCQRQQRSHRPCCQHGPHLVLPPAFA